MEKEIQMMCSGRPAWFLVLMPHYGSRRCVAEDLNQICVQCLWEKMLPWQVLHVCVSNGGGRGRGV
ncbi:hypothetical protein FKM82_020550 [Ascaphus truei]